MKETLVSALEHADELKGVFVLGLTKDSRPMLLGSTMDTMQKMFLVAFLNAWCVHHHFPPEHWEPFTP